MKKRVLSLWRAGRGFSMLELLAVLTVIGIAMVVLLGSYGSWGNVHALTGATGSVAAGLEEAKMLAKGRRQIVCFAYGSYVTNNVKAVTYFQPLFCQPTNGLESVTDVETALMRSQAGQVNLVPAAPEQRLPGSVRLRVYTANDSDTSISPEQGEFFFRPDGSAFSRQTDKRIRAHYISISTADAFSTATAGHTEPLHRILRVDFATGQINQFDRLSETTGEAKP
jgi:prepilin-type N-terminal cleavage/methylation domain-containing protein